MRQRIVNVTRGSNGLKVEPGLLDLEDGDWVDWQFHGLKDGEFGFISFKPPAPKFGPFHSLRSNGNAAFLGKGNTAVQGETHYAALILKLDGSSAVDHGEAIINNLALNPDTSPVITVTYEPGNPVLDVKPNPVGLNAGDTATWRFQLVNLPPNAFACFKFDSEAGNEATGPFAAFSASGVDATQASGMGFVATIPISQWPKKLTYHIQLRDWDGTLLASHDPIIDNLGPPVPG